MKYLFLLSKENIGLAREEVLSLTDEKEPFFVGNLLILDSNAKEIEFLSKRLAFTKKIFRLLFYCESKDIENRLSDYDWGAVYSGDFCVRIEGDSKYSEKDIAGYVWGKLNNPKVNLENPKTAIYLFFTGKKAHCCLLEKELKNDFDARKAHKRPELHPSSLNPRLARSLINLTGIKKGTLVDPMCGSGGILIEAGLMGLKLVGYDIDKIMINRSRINLEYFGVGEFKLVKKDALKLKKKLDYIVCDLPYGKNTKQKELKGLYSGFLSNLRKILGKRAVIVFPYFTGKKNMDYTALLKKNKLKIINKFNCYIHKSLSKRIFVVGK